MLCFLVSMVGVVDNDGSAFVVGVGLFKFLLVGLWDLQKVGDKYIKFVLVYF